MYGKVKLSKRQIKEDKFTSFMFQAKQQLSDNWQFYLIGLVVVVLLVVAAVYYQNSQATKRVDASNQFSDALSNFRSGNNQVAILGLQNVLENYSGSKIAEQATLLLGNINYQTKNYPEATRYYQMYLDKYKDSKLDRASALAGLASCQENQGNYADAAKQFDAAYNEYPDGPLAGDYNYSAMRDYLAAGDVEKARAKLDYIKKNFAGTQLEMRAERLFEEKSLDIQS
jgi:TolA-binding protein